MSIARQLLAEKAEKKANEHTTGQIAVCTGYENKGICRWCGGPLPDKRRKAYCSNKCQNNYEKTYIWPIARLEALKRANYKCQKEGCHVDVKEMWESAVHHIIPLNGSYRFANPLNHPDNLIVLCRKHHAKAHALINNKPKIKSPRNSPVQDQQMRLWSDNNIQ